MTASQADNEPTVSKHSFFNLFTVMSPSIRKYLYGALSVFCLVFAAFIFFNGKSKPNLPQLHERKGALAESPEWPAVKSKIEGLLADLEKKPNDVKTQLLLAKEFMQEGRVTGDYSYYNKAALELLRGVLAQKPDNFEAQCLMAMTYLSQHRFAEAKELAAKTAAANPHNSFVQGLLVDANVELGDYDAAVAAADKMVSVRPDIRSYSRVSYLREIYGDMPGSLEAIGMAIAAGAPGYEDTEWARMVQAHLYEDNGELDRAEGAYRVALQERAEYPFALAGLGKIARFRKDYPTAIAQFEKAASVMSDASFYEELIDLYRLVNQPEKADKIAKTTFAALEADNITANKNQDNGHYSDRDLALLCLKMNELDKALAYARTEHQRRPENIDACETLAWVLYKKGLAGEAAPLMDKAMRTNSKVPERLVHAGLIKVANGQQAEGTELLRKGLALKPYMDEALAAEANSKIKG